MQDSDRFKAFEHAGWETVVGPYALGFGPLTSQAIPAALDAVRPGTGVRLLDVASGPGYVAAAARERGADVVAVDFSSAMVEEARRANHGIDFQQGDAESLPFPDDSFDAWVCNFGMLHFARPDQALAEAFRVLRPGGRAAFTVWAPPSESLGFGIMLDAIQAHGDMTVPLPPGPLFFRFSDPDESRATLAKIGFTDATVTPIPQTWRLPRVQALFDALEEGTVRSRGLLKGQSVEQLAAIRSAIEQAVAPYATKTAIELPMPAVLSVGTKP